MDPMGLMLKLDLKLHWLKWVISSAHGLFWIKEMIDDVNDAQKSEDESECDAPSLVGGSFVEMESSCESFNDLETYSGSSSSE